MPFTLKALFKMAGGCYGGDVIEQTIVRVTGGPECHVEAMISEDPLLCFSAHMSTGVRTLPYLGGHSSLWYGLDTGVEVTPEALEWVDFEVGQPYNIFGAIISGFHCEARPAIQAMFCSEAFAQFMNACGGNLGLEKPNPHDLSVRLLELGAKRMDVLPPGLFEFKNKF